MNSCTSENKIPRAPRTSIPWGWLAVWIALGSATSHHPACAQTEAPFAASPPRGWMIDVPLPIQGEDDLRIRAEIEGVLAAESSTNAEADQRPTLVLSFTSGTAGQSPDTHSQFERCLSLARFLTQPDVSRLRTIATLQGPMVGHAALPILACEEIAVVRGASLVPLSSERPEPAVAEAYLDIASRRRTAPPALARALVDPTQHLLAVETLDEQRIIPESELAALQQTSTVVSIQTLTRPDSAMVLTADQLRQLHVATLSLEDHSQLAPALGLAALRRPLANGAKGPMRTIIWQLHGVLRDAALNERRRDLADLATATERVQIVVDLNSPGGAPAAAARLANALAASPSHIHSMAFVQEARADAWLIASACQRLTSQADAVLGGDGASSLTEREASALGVVASQIAARRGRLASLAAGLVDHHVAVHVYEHQVHRLQQPRSDAEHAQLPNRSQWRRTDTLDLWTGVTGATALRWGQVDQLADTLADALAPYGIVDEQLERPQPNWLTSQVERFGGIPWLPQLLVSIGCFALLAELSSPGVGAPGFLSAVCFVLFFWIQFLNGAADYLEAAMFVTGLLCLAFELLVLPGFGVFGFGGIAMLLSALVLASQTFVLPTNAYQWAQTPYSLGSLAAALLGIFGGAYGLSKLMPNTPGLRTMILKPPTETDATQTWDYLQGKPGVAQTPLRPGGKAAFGDEIVDVLSSSGPIEPGETVVVERVQGTRVFVRALETRAGSTTAPHTTQDPLPPEHWDELFDD